LNKEQKKNLKPEKKKKSKIREFFNALIYAAVAAFLIKIFLFEAFRIPTGSMENTLLVGDFLLVTKFTYGATTPRNIPFTDIRIPYLTLPGFKKPKVGDIIVFDFPGEQYELQSKEVLNYIKRCVGTPGDTIEIIKEVLYNNGNILPNPPNSRFENKVSPNTPNIGIFPQQYIKYKIPNYGLADLLLWTSDAKEVRPDTYYALIELKDYSKLLVPRERLSLIKEEYKIITNLLGSSLEKTDYKCLGYGWNEDNYGPIRIPKAGDIIKIDSMNYHTWRMFVMKEGSKIELRNNKVFIDGSELINGEYTVKRDYLFMMGDNRDRSSDSRFWGFMPVDNIVGQAFMIYWSWNANIQFSDFFKLLASVRLDRIGTIIK